MARTIEVNARSLYELIVALNGQPHEIRELMALKSKPGQTSISQLTGTINPIDDLEETLKGYINKHGIVYHRQFDEDDRLWLVFRLSWLSSYLAGGFWKEENSSYRGFYSKKELARQEGLRWKEESNGDYIILASIRAHGLEFEVPKDSINVVKPKEDIPSDRIDLTLQML